MRLGLTPFLLSVLPSSCCFPVHTHIQGYGLSSGDCSWRQIITSVIAMQPLEPEDMGIAFLLCSFQSSCIRHVEPSNSMLHSQCSLSTAYDQHMQGSYVSFDDVTHSQVGHVFWRRRYSAQTWRELKC